MTSSKKHNFFLKNGKQLKNSLVSFLSPKTEAVTSLFDIEEIIEKPNKKRFPKTLNLSNFKEIIKSTADRVPRNIKTTHIWAFSSLTIFAVFSLVFLLVPWKVRPVPKDKYSIYASTPLTLKDVTYSIYTRDSRAQKINSVFKKYKCPLEGLGEVFVYEADKYNIPWWLVAAVSFQESGCGKKTPEPSGLESYNAWGWAVYGTNVQTFDNWVRGIETVSEYMSEKFFKKGITDTCDIMKTYTPPSQGSWCEGVKYFGQEIQDFTSDEIPAELDQ